MKKLFLIAALLVSYAPLLSAQVSGGNPAPGIVGIADSSITDAKISGVIQPAHLPSTAAYTNKDNNWSTTQTSVSSFSVLAGLKVTGQTNFSGVAFASASLSGIAVTGASDYVCLAGSTLTWTSNGNIARVKFSGQSYSDNATSTINKFWVLLDGALTAGQSGPVFAALVGSHTQNPNIDTSFEMHVKPSSAGAHSVCLAVDTNGGTLNVGNSVIGEFSVTEF